MNEIDHYFLFTYLSYIIIIYIKLSFTMWKCACQIKQTYLILMLYDLLRYDEDPN